MLAAAIATYDRRVTALAGRVAATDLPLQRTGNVRVDAGGARRVGELTGPVASHGSTGVGGGQ